MTDPFIPLLTVFFGKCNDSTIVLLLLRCLGVFPQTNLPSAPLCAERLDPYILKLLKDDGASSNPRNEIIQVWSAADGKILESNEALFSTTQNVASALTLDEEQIQAFALIIYADVSGFEHNS